MHKQIESIYLVKMISWSIYDYRSRLCDYEKYQEQGEACNENCSKVVYQKREFLQEITSSGQRKHVTQRKIKFL